MRFYYILRLFSYLYSFWTISVEDTAKILTVLVDSVFDFVFICVCVFGLPRVSPAVAAVVTNEARVCSDSGRPY